MSIDWDANGENYLRGREEGWNAGFHAGLVESAAQSTAIAAEVGEAVASCKKCDGKGWYMATDGIRRQESQRCECAEPISCNHVAEVSYLRTDNYGHHHRIKWVNHYENSFPVGTKLYTHPAPAAVDGAMSEKDRIEFALRDAGFDLERAFAIAELATANSAEGKVVPDGFELDGGENGNIAIRCKDGRKVVLRCDRGLSYNDRLVMDFLQAMLNATASTSRGS